MVRRSVEDDPAKELRVHLERAIETHVARGRSRADAERRARLGFGLAQRTEGSRDAGGIALFETVLQDLRYGIRTMRRSTLLSLTAIATVALATAAIATVGSLADTLFWQLPRAPQSDRLVTIVANRGRPGGEGAVSHPDYLTFRDRTTTLSTLAAHYSTAPLFVDLNGHAKEVNGAVVSANYFPLLGLQPAAGRLFRADEDRVPDRDRVAVIGYNFWQVWFAGAPSAIGSTLTINGVAFTVIGVVPPQPAGLTPMPVELYIPTMMLRVGYRWCEDSLAVDCTILSMIGRLAPGRTLAEAAAEFPTIMPPAWAQAPVGENRGVVVQQPRGMSVDDEEPRLIATLAGVAVVLLIVCCANLAGLLSAQSLTRQAEFAIRGSLGAGPLRIVRQVLTESLLLALLGGLGGLMLSHIFIGALSRLFFSMDDEGHPLLYDFHQSPAVIAVTLSAAVAAGLLFSVASAMRAVLHPARPALLRSTTSRWSTSRWLLATQAAIAVAMLATSTLLAASARRIVGGTNYEASHVALMRVRPRLVKYTPARAQQFQRQVMQRLRSLPSVESATMVGIGTVLSGGSTRVALPGWPSDRRDTVRYNEVGPAYFSTLRIPLIAGREFDDRDTMRSSAVAVVNDTLAKRLWPDGCALGSTILIDNTPREIVGVVTDVSLNNRHETADPWVFAPFWQNPGQIDSRIAVRSAGDPATLLPALAREVHRIDPEVPIAELITLPVRMEGLFRPVRVAALFIGYAAALAMLLTAIGLYGALAFAVTRRSKEIGIRLALGATRERLIGSIVSEGLAVVITGAAVGVLLAIAAVRVVSHLLYGSADPDWLFYLAATVAVTGVGVGASLLPARRAAAIEPMVALRQD
jgi:macrolide transport system ATP-binding/permease protein